MMTHEKYIVQYVTVYKVQYRYGGNKVKLAERHV
jgi:hypothetical protein